MNPFDPNWCVIGFDPGVDGAMVSLEIDFHEPTAPPKSLGVLLSRKGKFDGLRDFLEACVLRYGQERVVLGIEVPGMVPGNGKIAYAKLASSVSFVLGLAAAWRLPFTDKIGPVRWQNAMDCRTKGDKKVPRQKLQAEYPWYVKQLQAAGADAFWIAMYTWSVGPYSSMIRNPHELQRTLPTSSPSRVGVKPTRTLLRKKNDSKYAG